MGQVLDLLGVNADVREAARKRLERSRDTPEWADRLAQKKDNPRPGGPRWLYHRETAEQCLRLAGLI